jgi:hypothetical protein
MSDIKGLREISNDPFGKLLTALSKKFSAFLAKDQAELVENPEDIYSDGQDVESALKFHNFAMSKKFNLTTQYYSAAEPDSFNVHLYLAGVWPTLGYQLPDRSGFNNHATITGEPILVDGTPFNPGIVDSTSDTKSIAISMNRAGSQYENQERLIIADDSDLTVSGLTTGFSMFFRFRVRSTASQGGVNRTIVHKRDDDTPTNATMLQVSPTGRLFFYVTRSSVTTGKQTASNAILVNTVYDVFVTYTIAGNVNHIYVNNVDMTLTDIGVAPSWGTPVTNHDMYIFNKGDTSSGYVDGDLYGPIIYWRDDVITSTEVGRMWVNKLTTANIPFGQVMVSNYASSSV